MSCLGLCRVGGLSKLRRKARSDICWAGVFLKDYFYKESAAAWRRLLPRRRRLDCRPRRPRRATGRDTVVRRTWIALSMVRPRCAPRGAFLRVLAVVKFSASARIWRRSRAYPNGRTALDRPRFASAPTTIDHQNFFASKGSVCWSLLVPGPAFFASWTASRCLVNRLRERCGTLPPSSQLYRYAARISRPLKAPDVPTTPSALTAHLTGLAFS